MISLPVLCRRIDFFGLMFWAAFVLGMLRSWRVSAVESVIALLFLLGVAAARSSFWRVARPGIASAAAGGGIGVLVVLHAFGHVWTYRATVLTYYSWMYLCAEFALTIGVCSLLGYGTHLVLAGFARVVAAFCAAFASAQKTPEIPIVRTRQLLRIPLIVTVVLASACALYGPAQTCACRFAARRFFIRFLNGPPPSPMEAWLIGMHYGGYPYGSSHTAQAFLDLYYAFRERLVESGALIHRKYVFQSIKQGSAEARMLWEAAMIAFPDNINTTSPANTREAPLVLEVWAPPEEIPAWEQFAVQHGARKGAREEVPGTVL